MMLDVDEDFVTESGDLSAPQEHYLDPNSYISSSFVTFQRYVSSRRMKSAVQPNPKQNSTDVNASLPSSVSANSFFQSTTFLHAYDRPSELPQKNPGEAKRHRVECDKINQHITKKHQEKLSLLITEQKKRNNSAVEYENRVKYWRNDVIPNWDIALQSQKLHDDWWLGIPSALRSQVWRMVIGNPLGITRELFESCLTQSQHTIRRLDRERLLAEGFDLPSLPTSLTSTRYATLPTHSLSRFSRIHSMPDEGGGSTWSGSANYSTFRPRVIRQVSFNLAGVEAMLIPGKIMTLPPMPLAPPPSLSISGDLSSNEESSLQVIQLDVSRTFPTLGVFQTEGSHKRNLHDLLAAFVAYQPTLGYLQGMSFIAGILLLVMDDIYAAFIAFATLMNRPSFYAFYSLDESEFTAYFGAFDALLEEKMPRLFHHLKTCRLDSRFYLFDWLFTVFSRSLPLEVDLRIWDLFLRDGETALILAALGILRMYEDQLLLYDFDHLASFLTGPMPTSMSPDLLTECMRSFDFSTDYIKDTLKKARTLTTDSAKMKADQISSRTECDPRAPVEAGEKGQEGQRSRWSIRALRNKQTKYQDAGVNDSGGCKSNNDAVSLSKSGGRNVPHAAVADLVAHWSQDVCLEFPKREIL